jgi:hypothetical protein
LTRAPCIGGMFVAGIFLGKKANRTPARGPRRRQWELKGVFPMIALEKYGNGPSPALEQTVAESIHTDFVEADLEVLPEEKDVLRALAEEVATLAALPAMSEKRDLWRKHNRLEKTRPIIFCDPENGWNEIITDSQMRCKTKIARRWEMNLRKEIFWGKEMGDDRPVEPIFNVPYTCSADDWGVQIKYHMPERTGSYVWESPIKNYATDLPRIHPLTFAIDWNVSKACLQLASEIFGGILAVRQKGTWWWSLGITYPAILLRGMQNMFTDFRDYPGEIKQMFSIICQGQMNRLDYLEANNLLSLNNDGTYIGSGGYGYTDELPPPNFDGKVRCKDMWGFTDSQESVGVSPKMYEEFIFPYEKPIMDRFGLTCYGCCEPLHSRWNVVKQHHNLRRVSCSAWANLEKMAANLQGDYILSLKPSPATLAVPSPDWGAIRSYLHRAVEVCKDCRVEIIMKDNHTLADRPEHAVEWVRIAQEEAGAP